jgi:hypothetical protein
MPAVRDWWAFWASGLGNLRLGVDGNRSGTAPPPDLVSSRGLPRPLTCTYILGMDGFPSSFSLVSPQLSYGMLFRYDPCWSVVSENHDFLLCFLIL